MSVNSTEYWAALPDLKAFAGEAFSRFTQSPSGIYGNYNNNMWLAYLAYYGAISNGNYQGGPSSAQLMRTGDQGSVTELKVNWLHSIVNAKHQLIITPELTWECTPINGDVKSTEDAARGSHILEYLWKQNNYSQQAKQAVLESILFGESFLFTMWETNSGTPQAFNGETVQYSGEIKCLSVPSWNVVRDSSVDTYDKSQWFAIRMLVNKWDLIAKYPDQKNEIISNGYIAPAMAPMVPGRMQAPAVDDFTTVYYFFHKRTPALPLGRMTIMLSPTCILSDEKLPECYSDIPLHRMFSGNYPNSPYGYTALWESLAIQELADAIQTALATNIISFGMQMISAEANSNLPIDQIGNGPMVIYRPPNTEPPVALQLTASPPEAFKDLDRLYNDLMRILGVNDIVMGHVPPDQNAAAQALTVSTAIQANSKEQGNYVRFVNSVGKSMLKIYKEFATEKQKVAIIGIQGPSSPTISTFDKTDFEGVDDVYVSIGNPMSQSISGRLAMAQLFKDQGVTLVPEQIVAVVETGRYEPIIQGLQEELLLINGENEMILKGQKPLVKITDSHQMHVREHRNPTFNIEARMNPAINQAADQHIAEHMAFLGDPNNTRIFEIMGQAVPPPQPPAPPPQAAPSVAQKQVGKVQQGMQNPLQASQPQLSETKLPEAPLNPATGTPFPGTQK